jgi:hypothetical protein
MRMPRAVVPPWHRLRQALEAEPVGGNASSCGADHRAVMAFEAMVPAGVNPAGLTSAVRPL